eukprot:Hpha_TRINITY_DN16479_c3_g1::TRINITY_DN16479_c3_g1_i1::g.161053::m.161053
MKEASPAPPEPVDTELCRLKGRLVELLATRFGGAAQEGAANQQPADAKQQQQPQQPKQPQTPQTQQQSQRTSSPPTEVGRRHTPELRGTPSQVTKSGSSELGSGRAQRTPPKQRPTIENEVAWAAERSKEGHNRPATHSRSGSGDKQLLEGERTGSFSDRPHAPTPKSTPAYGMHSAATPPTGVPHGFSPWPTPPAYSHAAGAGAQGGVFQPLPEGAPIPQQRTPSGGAPPLGVPPYCHVFGYPGVPSELLPQFCERCSHAQQRHMRRLAKMRRREQRAAGQAELQKNVDASSTRAIAGDSGGKTSGTSSKVSYRGSVKSPRSAFSEPTTASRSSYTTCSDSPSSSTPSSYGSHGCWFFEQFGPYFAAPAWYVTRDPQLCWNCSGQKHTVATWYPIWVENSARMFAAVQGVNVAPPDYMHHHSGGRDRSDGRRKSPHHVSQQPPPQPPPHMPFWHGRPIPPGMPVRVGS